MYCEEPGELVPESTHRCGRGPLADEMSQAAAPMPGEVATPWPPLDFLHLKYNCTNYQTAIVYLKDSRKVWKSKVKLVSLVRLVSIISLVRVVSLITLVSLVRVIRVSHWSGLSRLSTWSAA